MPSMSTTNTAMVANAPMNLKIIICLLCLCIFVLEMAQSKKQKGKVVHLKHSNKGRKLPVLRKPMKMGKLSRATIIKCCGRTSCSQGRRRLTKVDEGGRVKNSTEKYGGATKIEKPNLGGGDDPNAPGATEPAKDAGGAEAEAATTNGDVKGDSDGEGTTSGGGEAAKDAAADDAAATEGAGDGGGGDSGGGDGAAATSPPAADSSTQQASDAAGSPEDATGSPAAPGTASQAISNTGVTSAAPGAQPTNAPISVSSTTAPNSNGTGSNSSVLPCTGGSCNNASTQSALNNNTSPSGLSSSVAGSSIAAESTTRTTIKFVLTIPSTNAPAIAPTCDIPCVKNNSLFSTGGFLNDPEIHGFWEDACGKQFVFGRKLVNWEQNVAKCCSLGMTPIAIEDAAMHTCTKEFVDGNKWKYNLRYWSAGVRIGTGFQWCQSTKTFSDAFWRPPKQPDNVNGTENCVQMYINKTDSTIYLEDRHCAQITAFACMGPPPPTPNCSSPVCPKINCARDPKLFNSTANFQFLTKPSAHGIWTFVQHRLYLFSHPTDILPYESALKKCCALGMKLSNLHQEFKFTHLMNATSNATIETNTKFWTSGSDIGCEGTFGYCSAKRLARREAKWAPGEPDNKNGNENCLAATVSASSVLLSDEVCASPMRYICEGWQNSGAKPIEEECAVAFDLNQTMVALTMNTTSVLNLRQKCFMKCYGENIGMVVNGNIMESLIIAQFASISAGDINQLISMYTTIDHCSGLTRGMDECDKVAALVKCGQENAPEATAALIAAIESTISGDDVLYVSKPGNQCPASFTCVIDEDLKTLYDTTPVSTFVQTPELRFYMAVACNKKYLFGRFVNYARKSIADFMTVCCSFRLRLVQIDSAAEITCLEPYVTVANNGQNLFGNIDASFQKYMTSSSCNAPHLANPFTGIWCYNKQLYTSADYGMTNEGWINDAWVTMIGVVGKQFVSMSDAYFFVCEPN